MPIAARAVSPGGVPKGVVQGLEVVGVREDQDRVVRVALEDPLRSRKEGLAASQSAGQQVALGGGQAPVKDNGVGGPSGQRRGGRGD
ncbi:hypothetical protein [Streptomyces chryseus]